MPKLAHYSIFLFVFIALSSLIMLASAESEIDRPSTSKAHLDITDHFDGHARLRLRAHRRRHKHRGTATENDELFDMLTRDLDRDVEKTRKTKNITPSRREKNEVLCSSERRTVDLNNDREEFEPPFIVEERCRNTVDYEKGITQSIIEQKCVHDLLRCVQRYGEVHVSRRPIGSAHWIPHTLRDIPLGCDCMWPVDKYGHQEL